MMLPLVDLEVIGPKKKVKIKALLDTGFSGYLCLPSKIAVDLELPLSGRERFELASGDW